jgi:multidrug efflux pump subunit AcrA (membrane-fusion protein)
MTPTPAVPDAPPPRRGRSRLPFAVILVILFGAMVALVVANGGFRGDGGSAGASPTPSTPGVVPSDTGVVAEGRAVPVRTAELAMPAAGRVAEVTAKEGDEVSAGAPLLRLDTAAADADVASAQAARTSATASSARAEAAVRQAQANVDAASASVTQAQAARRAAAAARDQVPSGASSAVKRQARAEVDQAAAGVDAARAQLAAFQAALDSAKAALDGAKADEQRAASAVDAATAARNTLALTAPFAGTVVSVEPAVGDLVQPGEVVVRLADLSAWRFETTDLSETNVARLAVGQPVTVTVDGLPGQDIAAKVESVGGFGATSQGDIVYRVVAAPTGAVPDGLRWNMTVTLEVDTGS